MEGLLGVARTGALLTGAAAMEAIRVVRMMAIGDFILVVCLFFGGGCRFSVR
jgi:hypothetical protein